MRSRYLPVERNRGQDSAQVTNLLTMNDLILISSIFLITTLVFWGAEERKLYFAYALISVPISVTVIAKNKWLHKRQLEDFLLNTFGFYKRVMEIQEDEK